MDATTELNVSTSNRTTLLTKLLLVRARQARLKKDLHDLATTEALISSQLASLDGVSNPVEKKPAEKNTV